MEHGEPRDPLPAPKTIKAAKRQPLLMSAHSGEGVTEALRALLKIIDQDRAVENAANAPAPEPWRP